jgi:hypothetical protein
MAWLIFAAALACFALAITLPLGTALVLLLLAGALGLLVAGTTRLIGDRGGSTSRSAAPLLDAAEMQRLARAGRGPAQDDTP